MKILVINGPNLNMLGIREREIYGSGTYDELVSMIDGYAKCRGVEVIFFQSNHEGAIIDRIQEAYFEKLDGIVLNPAAYTHTSVAIADALKAVHMPYVEVHISNVSARENYRKISYVRDAAIACISGKGFAGYTEAIDMLVDRIGEENEG